MNSPRVWLASKSPRRQEMLREAGIDAIAHSADIDDGTLRHGEVPVEWWVMALAYLKARRVADMLEEASWHRGIKALREIGLVLGADTVCAVGRMVLGQPRDGEDARRMLQLMRGREHRTLTGVCLLPVGGDRCQESGDRKSLETRSLTPATRHLTPPATRLIVFDAAIVRFGNVTDAQIDSYVASNEWRGKAGAYNLSERIAAGWPISCLGDPTTVMGLPMQRLAGWIKSFGLKSVGR